MAVQHSLTRRKVIGLGAGAIASAIAGCTGGDGQSGTPTESPSAFLDEIAFEGTDMVVQLVDDHEISRLNLIAPDGSLFGQTVVPVGATTARIEILDIKPEGAGFKHYTPGDHELVAVSEAGSTSTTVNLEPDLRIVDVRQYREGTRASDYGKLVVDVENVGTGPTWVYSITYQDSPNFAANGETGGDPGVLSLERPTGPDGAVVLPGQSSSFVGVKAPLLFPDQGQPSCSGVEELTLFVESPILPPIEKSVRVSVRGEIQSVGLTGEYTCTEMSIESI